MAEIVKSRGRVGLVDTIELIGGIELENAVREAERAVEIWLQGREFTGECEVSIKPDVIKEGEKYMPDRICVYAMTKGDNIDPIFESSFGSLVAFCSAEIHFNNHVRAV